MNAFLDALRGPAIGVVVMIILFSGAIVVTAFAALLAQVGLLMRLRPWQAPPAKTPTGVYPSGSSPSRSVREQEGDNAVVDGEWWYETTR